MCHAGIDTGPRGDWAMSFAPRRCPNPRDRRGRLPRDDRTTPARAGDALLPPARLRAGRRGPGPGDLPRRLAQLRRLRGPLEPAHLAVPDRDEPQPERPA